MNYGELTRWLGDAYEASQRKDPEGVVKRNALIQTPGFVGAFLLDRTLTPALETFGLEGLRVIDPCCGTGHLLCQAFDRLWPLWAEHAPGRPPAARAQKVLDAIHGIDVDRMAVALCRFRLGYTAATAAGIADRGAAWKINVAWGDALLPADDPLQPFNRRPIPAWCAGGLTA